MQDSITQIAIANGATSFDATLAPHMSNNLVMSPLQIAATVKAQINQLSGEPTAYQRLHPEKGWIHVDIADIKHYENKGQEVRPLFLAIDPIILAYVDTLEKRLEAYINAACAGDWPVIRSCTDSAIEELGNKPDCLK